MTVGEIVYRILGDDTQFNSVMGKVGTTASKALSAISKAALAATAAAATAVSALSKTAIESYAEYEQLVGGVETLFGTSADVIKGYADEAYKTAGMSANAYMETVTGFSASLLQGLGGDTAKAAEIANQAVIDMSDNANKMGTDMTMIQNAYQGFAKQNYTMLDNLKLGYGGTQSEMARLINDSGVLGDAMTVTAETVNSVSFDKIIEAIHVIQTNMDITGTTAKEASTTIQGSIASMQAAWENCMVGIADPTQDFDALLGNLIDSVITVSDNLMPRIMAVLPQMAEGVAELAENILPLVPETLEKMLPSVLDGANALISALLDVLSSIADTAIPIVTENADEIIGTLLSGLVDAVPRLASSAADLCTALITAILDNADILTQGAVDIVLNLANGIINNLSTLVSATIEAVETIVTTLTQPENLVGLVEAAVGIIEELANALIDPNTLVSLVDSAFIVVENIAVALLESIGPITDAAINICEQMAVKLAEFDWAEAAKQSTTNLVKALLESTIDENVTAPRAVTDYSNKTKEELDTAVGVAQKQLTEIMSIMSDLQNGLSLQDVPEWVKKGATNAGITIVEFLATQEDEIKNRLTDLNAAYEGAESDAERAERKHNEKMEQLQKEREEVIAKYGSFNAASYMADTARGFAVAGEDVTKSSAEVWENIEKSLANLDSALAKHQISESDYWSERKALLEANRDEESEEWWKYYDEVTSHYEKLAETEAKAAESAAKEQESALKASVEDKFRGLETEQLEKGYDDSWLLEQERAFIETLDHNSEVYKDYNLKLLQEQKKADESAVKEVEQTAEKQKSALEKAYNSIIKSRDSLASSLNQDAGSIFNSSEEVDKHTGAKKKSSGIDTSAFEKKLAAKKKLTSKIAELMEKDVPDSLITELLKQDPEEALAYASQLLKDPKKLSQIKSMFKEDEGVSNILANMVTENSEEFESLGSEAGSLFGESFAAAFRENWENAMSSVFGEDYIDTASVSVSSANAQAGRESTSAAASGVASESVSTGTGTVKAASGGNAVYKIVDLNGSYVATVVEKENKSRKTTGGG